MNQKIERANSPVQNAMNTLTERITMLHEDMDKLYVILGRYLAPTFESVADISDSDDGDIASAFVDEIIEQNNRLKQLQHKFNDLFKRLEL